MRNKFREILKTHTVRQSAVTTVSTFMSAGLGAVFYLILARFLGASDYGLFSLSIAILIILVTIANVGTDQGLIRFVGQNRNTDKYLQYAHLALRTKIITGISIWALLWLFARPLGDLIFHRQELIGLFPVIGFGVFGYLMITYSTSLAQAMQKYLLWGGLQVGSNIFRLILILIFFLLGVVTPFWAIFIFSFASLAGFFVSWCWLDRRIFRSSPESASSREFWKFNRWTAASTILSSFVSRLDILLTSRFLDLASLGSYSLANTMVSFLPQLSSSIGAVTSAKFAGFTDSKHARTYLTKATLFSTLISLGVTVIMIPAAIFVILFAGRGYASSFVPFLILLFSLIIFMAGNPLRDALLYYHDRPQSFFWTNLGQGIVLIITGLFLIPRFGTIGTALTVLCGHLFLGLSSLWYYRSLSGKK